jgi:arginine decarboxylase
MGAFCVRGKCRWIEGLGFGTRYGVKHWTTRDSAELYNIAGWSNGYFDISEEGNVVLTSHATHGGSIDIKRVVDDLVRRGLSMPLLLRFSDVLRRRVEEIQAAFNGKRQEYGYKGRYQLVMPIKVNQEKHVVEELLEYGRPYGLGLEAGSRPELLVAIAMMDKQDGVIVCNGYKDTAYIETALLAQRLGIRTLIIVDRFQELAMICEASKRLGIQPNIGVRSKLASKGSGRWAESGGDRSKFGLTAAELVSAVEFLQEQGMLDRLVCLHFHIGSQITAIRAVKDALGEATRIFIDLYKMGAPLSYVDVGGGLAVDYDGSKTNFHASKNYSLEEYAGDVIYAVGSALDEHNIPHPTIISESGRALVAHHSMLVFNVLGQSEEALIAPSTKIDPVNGGEVEEHHVIKELREVVNTVSRKNYQEAYHDAVQLKEDALSLYRHGILDLRDRARVEQMFWAAARKIWKIAGELDYVPEDLEGLGKQLADTYYCNFSLFQSVPDFWAVKALFPVMPIHRLKEQPTRHGILADLTCDSDGKMDQFIGLHDVKDSLELHNFNPTEPYFLGVFLVGAYQEILGDLHNLFGDVNAVHIECDRTSGYSVRHVVEGDSVRDVLAYVSYDQRQLMERLRRNIELALSAGTMTFEQSAALVKHFEAGMSGYTYLEDRELVSTLLSSIVPTPKLAVVPDNNGFTSNLPGTQQKTAT